MDDTKCSTVRCLIKYRFELVGMALILLATILTVISMSSLGILAMFVIGGLLCCHQYCLKDRASGDKKEEGASPAKKPHRPRRKPQNKAKPAEPSTPAND